MFAKAVERPEVLVVDANLALAVCNSGRDFADLGYGNAVAPPLMFSEFLSTARLAAWKGETRADRPRVLLDRLAASSLREANHPGLREEALRIAEALGWARTYDAEYCALASVLDCRLVTLDGRLRRGADRLGFVVTPSEL